MYKILVVDDEQIVLDAVKFIIDKNITDASVVGVARSGREAIEKVSLLNPHIILMDIRMPGINGIDAIKSIKESHPNVQIVIISAYEQFEFAKDALNLGVKEYILKPINKNKLIDTINSIIKNIREEEKKKIKEIENIEKFRNILAILEHGFIYSVLLNKDFGDEINRYKDLFELDEGGGYIMIIDFGEGDNAISLTNKIGSSIKSREFYSYIRDVLKYKCKCIVGPTIINRIVVYVSVDNNSDEYSQRLKSIEVAEYLIKKIQQSMEMTFYIGIGSYKGINELHLSYEEALKALRYDSENNVVHIMDITEDTSSTLKNFIELEKQMLDMLELGKEDEVMKITNKIFHTIINYVPQDRRNKLIELIILVYRSAYHLGILEDDLINYNEYVREISEIDDNSIQQWCFNRIKYIARKICEQKQNKISSIVSNAQEYINNNYSEDISLEDVSKLVCISPQYFSRLFKEETGYNFIEHLTQIRITKAKELIKANNLSIKEVCFEVGYNDPNYFSRLFKKVVGVSPTDYIKNI